MARADCWPPLNAIEKRQENPVQVGSHTFTTGFYSYWVERYYVDRLHCEESINRGPWQWDAEIGLGGESGVGPRVTSSSPSSHSNTSQVDNVPVALPNLKPLAQLPSQLPSMPSLPPLP